LDRVFKFSPADLVALKQRSKFLQVTIEHEWTEEYDSIKGYSIDEIFSGLSADAKRANPLTLEFKLVDKSDGLDDDMEAQETFNSDEDMV
jgi:hypothetical protein